MSFELSHETVWSCTACRFISTKKHFRSGEPPKCTMCGADAEKSRTIEKQTGMRDVQYTQLLQWLKDTNDGIGAKLISRLRDTFESGDEFIDACRACHEGDCTKLTNVKGIGEKTARTKISASVAAKRDWPEPSPFDITT